MRMKIDTGNLDISSVERISTDAGTSGIKALFEKAIALYEYNNQKKINEAYGEELKNSIITLMQSLGIDKVEHKGITCTLSERKSKSFDENALMEFCKTLNKEGLIKTVEVVDMDVLEDLIYRKELDPEAIKPFLKETKSIFPRVSGKLVE